MTKTPENDTEAKESLAKKIWLAGLGAYGQGFGDAVDQVHKVNDKTSQRFSELVKKGSELEDKARHRVDEFRTQSTQTIDQRVNDVRKRLGLRHDHSHSDEDSRIQALEEKVEALTEMVNSLAAAKAPKQITKAKK